MNLERIERRLDDLNAKMDEKLSIHDRVVANHDERITTLEKR